MKDDLPWEKVTELCGFHGDYDSGPYEYGHKECSQFESFPNDPICKHGRFIPESDARELWEMKKWSAKTSTVQEQYAEMEILEKENSVLREIIKGLQNGK